MLTMAEAKAGAASAGGEEAGEKKKEEERKVANKGDLGAVKHVLDELVAEVVTTECEYPEDFTSSNVRILLSLVACLMAPASHFLPPYLEKHGHLPDLPGGGGAVTKDAVVLLCLVVYGITFVALVLFQYLYEKEAILFTRQKKGAFSSSGLRVSTRMERFDDAYKITVEERKAAGGKASKNAAMSTFTRDPMTFQKSITKWIDEDGVVAQDLLQKDVKKYIKSFEKSAYKSKKAAP